MLQQWREQWAEHANQSLEREGIQDRISHESHAKRNLIIFPAVHLGHVAHEMEMRGVQTDRGTINRDRQEYNRLVVDLQTYREEKKALEQEKARKQELRQQSERFNTPAERAHLKEASKLLNIDREPTLKEIFVKRKELDQWENQVNKDDQQIRWKDETIRSASETYRWIQLFENQRQQAQQHLETINWMNPFKLKENRMTKEQSELEIFKAEDQITLRDKKLHSYRKKLGFHTEKEFHQVQSQHHTEYPGLLEKIDRRVDKSIVKETS
ncbi:MobA/MobL family protein [Peribacillus sp. SIMBA_075]